ncbi:MAG: tetratricopeptide repeat protein [Bacteroidota bacterium]|nr:tetratricopeptide repeat protein [Bacteroidota bacterium]
MNMRIYITLTPAILACIFLTDCKSGLVTTSNSCYNLIQSSQAQNKSGDYADALANFNEVLKKCDAYDAKEKAYAGKAAALNGLKQYDEALAAAEAGLKINKTSIDNLFEKANAELGLGMVTEARNDLSAINALTQKNQNVAERATIYAKMAAIDSRQKQYTDALNNIKQAITLDNANLDFYILQGDILSASGDYTGALDSYDQAISKGKNDAVSWKAKTELMIKMNQKKYGTDNVSVLAKKMSSGEKQNLCETINTAKGRGMKDINIDMVQVTLCK